MARCSARAGRNLKCGPVWVIYKQRGAGTSPRMRREEAADAVEPVEVVGLSLPRSMFKYLAIQSEMRLRKGLPESMRAGQRLVLREMGKYWQ